MIPLSIFFVTPSCRDCDAYSNPSSYAVGVFYDKNGDYSSPLTINFESVNGIDGAEIFPMSNKKYLLPLKVSTRETGFSFVAKGLSDTTYISYTSGVVVNGPDCGAYEQITGLQVSPTEGDEGKNAYEGESHALFDSVVVAAGNVVADTMQENIRFIIDICDSEEKSASRNVITTYYDNATGKPQELVFNSIYVKGKEITPIYDASDRYSTIYLPLEGTKTTTFVFELEENGNKVSQELKINFEQNYVISDDADGCIFTTGVGNLLLDSAGTGVEGIEFDFPNGPIFKKMQIDRTTINTNPDWPNVKLFI